MENVLRPATRADLPIRSWVLPAIRVVGSDAAHRAALAKTVADLRSSLEVRLAEAAAMRGLIMVARSRSDENLGQLVIRPGRFAWLWIGVPDDGDPELAAIVAHEFGHLIVEGGRGWPATLRERSPGDQVVSEYLAQRLGMELGTQLDLAAAPPRSPHRAMWLWQMVCLEARRRIDGEIHPAARARLTNALTLLLREWAYAATDQDRSAVGWHTPVAAWIASRPGVADLLAPIANPAHGLPKSARAEEIVRFRRPAVRDLDRLLAEAMANDAFVKSLATGG